MYRPAVRRQHRLVLILSLLFVAIAADEMLGQQKRSPLDLRFTYNSFSYSDTSSFVEIAYQFSNRGLSYHKGEDGSPVGKLYVRLRLRRSSSARPVFVEWGLKVPQPDPAAPIQPMVGLRSVELAPGDYQAQLLIEDDVEPERRDSVDFLLRVPSFSGSKVQLSDLEIASEADMAELPDNPFYKNGYVIVPNVLSLIAEPFLLMHSYLEIYNAEKVASAKLHLVYQIADSARRLFYQRDDTLDRPTSEGIVKIDMFPVDQLTSGEYYLIAKLYNGLASSATDSSMVFRRFVVINRTYDSVIAARRALANSSVIPVSGDLVDPFYAGMTDEQLDIEWKKTSVIATEQQRDIWNGLSAADAKARFLTSFWVNRDPTPGTPVNEEHDAFQKRVEKARKLYRGPSGKNGWDSDRGRILLQYGEPDETEPHPQDFNKRPYEIWRYRSTSYEFVFVDRSQIGNYVLVHSDAPHELRHENWENDYVLINKKWTNE